MFSMFQRAQAFNQPLSNWEVSAVANMSAMFKDAILFNQPINSWDVSSVTLMPNMFENAEAFNQNINVNEKLARYAKYGVGFGEGGALTAVLQKYNVTLKDVDRKKFIHNTII